MQRIIKIQKANSMKTCTCRYDRQLSLLRFFPYLAYFFNLRTLSAAYNERLKDLKDADFKIINHHVCNIEIDFNDSDQRLRYFNTIKVRC